MASQISAASANREYYRDRASSYDRSERCVTAPAERARLREHLRRAIQLNPSARRVLDAGGGSGNAASVLLDLGLEPVVLDVSPDMLAIWREKAARRGYEAPTIIAEVGVFLRENDAQWDLIVFSSVLHHLDEPIPVLRAAIRRLAPNGVLVTIFDTIEAGRVGRALRRADWISYALAHDRRALSAALRARRQRAAAGASGEPHVGQLAERHALTGLADLELAREVEAAGGEIVRHDRFVDARNRWVATAFKTLRRPSAFSLIARRRSEPA